MKSTRNGLGLALLALSLSFGGSLVRAEEPASPFENIVSDPLAKVVQTIELRLAGLEATMMAFAGSFSSDHITTRRLCVSDGSGETCITKAQLDALLKLQVQLGQAPATAEQPAVIVGEASAPPVTTATAPAAEPAETVATVATVTMESPKPAAEPAETVATVTMESPKPAAEAAEAVIAEAVIIDSPKAPAESASTEPATVTAAARTRKDDEPANLDSVASFSPVPESKSANEEAPAPERVE